MNEVFDSRSPKSPFSPPKHGERITLNISGRILLMLNDDRRLLKYVISKRIR